MPAFQMIAQHQMPGVSFASGGDPVSTVLHILHSNE